MIFTPVTALPDSLPPADLEAWWQHASDLMFIASGWTYYENFQQTLHLPSSHRKSSLFDPLCIAFRRVYRNWTDEFLD